MQLKFFLKVNILRNRKFLYNLNTFLFTKLLRQLNTLPINKFLFYVTRLLRPSFFRFRTHCLMTNYLIPIMRCYCISSYMYKYVLIFNILNSSFPLMELIILVRSSAKILNRIGL